MKTLPIWLGTTPPIGDTIIDDATDLPLDLTGDTVTLVVQSPSGTQTSYAATINPDQVGHKGEVTITTPVAVSAAQSYWLAWWHVVTAALQTRDTPTFALQILKHGQEAPITVGPCSSWIDEADVLAVCPSANAELAASAAEWASDVLFAVLGRQFKGVCFDTIRPARTGCGCWNGPGFGLPMSWGLWGALWGWGYSDIPQPLGCGVLAYTPLAYPVSQILQVKIDGSAVSPSTYRVDEQRRLVRLTDPITGLNPGWPACQNLALPDSEVGTWSVQYTYGVAPPTLARNAAAQLACQLVSGASGAPCALPTGTTKITRQGVTIDRGLLASWLGGGSTGLALVDAAIAAYNPNRLPMESGVYSPDLPKYGLHTG